MLNEFIITSHRFAEAEGLPELLKFDLLYNIGFGLP